MTKVMWLVLMMVIPLVAVGQELTPIPDPIGSGGATETEQCSQLAIQIGAKRAAIAMLTARIAASKTTAESAEKEMVIAAANAANDPLMFPYWNAIVMYHAGRVLYWADAIHADEFLRGSIETELDDLLQAYALAGC